MPTPSIFSRTSTSVAKPRKTATMIAAAAEIVTLDVAEGEDQLGDALERERAWTEPGRDDLLGHDHAAIQTRGLGPFLELDHVFGSSVSIGPT